jgi:hypothetical protein
MQSDCLTLLGPDRQISVLMLCVCIYIYIHITQTHKFSLSVNVYRFFNRILVNSHIECFHTVLFERTTFDSAQFLNFWCCDCAN